MNLKLQSKSRTIYAFLMALFSVWGWGQTTIAFNGAEASPTLIAASNTFTSSSTNSGTPASRIKSGGNSFQKANATGTFISEGVSLSGYTSKVVEVWNSMVSTTSGNGIDSSVDKLEVYVSSTSTFSATPDVTVNASTANVRWGITGTGVISTTAGTPVTQTYSTGGTRTGVDAFSKIVINLPDAWANAYIKIVSISNAAEEVWCIDDIAVKGEIVTSTIAPTVTGDNTLTSTVGSAYNYQVVATENPTNYTISAGALPNGLTLNSTDGKISGTPTEAGVFTFSVQATNTVGNGVGNFELNIAKGTQTSTNSPSYNLFTGANNVILNATTNANKTITYVSSNTSVINIVNNNEINVVGVGTATITATASGDANWNAYNSTINVVVTSAVVYQKITSTAELAEGYYVISNENDEFAVGAPSSPSYSTVPITPSGGVLSNPADNIIVKIASLGNNVYTLQRIETGNYIGWSSSTTLTAPASVTSDSQRWTIVYDIVNQYFTVKNNGDNTTSGRYLRYNASTGDFRAYPSSSTLTNSYLQLYKKLPSTWNGSTWSNGAPNATTDAIITGNYSTTSLPAFVVNNITIKNGGVLEVTSGNTISAVNVTVEDGGNLIQKEGSTLTYTGAFKALKNGTSEINKYAFWTSPVVGQNLTNIYTGGTPAFITEYDTAADYYVNAASTTSIFAKGYSIKTPVANAALVFEGTPNNGTQTFTLATSGNGFNLIGNPYPSSLNLGAFYTANSARISSTFYFWDNKSTNVTLQNGATTTNYGYATFNAANGANPTWVPAPNGNGGTAVVPTGDVANIGQGFIVKTLNTSVDTSLTFNNDMRSATNGTFFNKNNSSTEGKFWLRLNSGYNTNNTFAVDYTNGASDSFDNYDSKAMGMGSDAFYTLADAQKLIIQGKESFDINDVVPVGAKHFQNGNFTIALVQKEGLFNNGQAIYLHDKVLGTYTDLQNGAYTFTANAGENTERFEIVYKLNVLATAEIKKDTFEVFRDGQDFVVRNNKNIEKVEIFDATGRKIQTINEDSKVIRVQLASKGVYILKALSEGKEYTKKIIK